MYVLLIIAIYSDSCVEKTLIYYPHITKKCDICDMIQIETTQYWRQKEPGVCST